MGSRSSRYAVRVWTPHSHCRPGISEYESLQDVRILTIIRALLTPAVDLSVLPLLDPLEYVLLQASLGYGWLNYYGFAFGRFDS